MSEQILPAAAKENVEDNIFDHVHGVFQIGVLRSSCLHDNSEGSMQLSGKPPIEHPPLLLLVG